MHNHFRPASLLLLLWTLILTSCGAEPDSIQAAAKVAGCAVEEYSSGQNIFNGKSARCANESRVYWFPTEEANKNHGELCASFGGKKVGGGATWTHYNPSC